jgi:hypothetical protein
MHFRTPRFHNVMTIATGRLQKLTPRVPCWRQSNATATSGGPIGVMSSCP